MRDLSQPNSRGFPCKSACFWPSIKNRLEIDSRTPNYEEIWSKILLRNKYGKGKRRDATK